MPDDVASEKVQALRALGADVQLVRPASIVDKKQVSESPISVVQRPFLIPAPRQYVVSDSAWYD